MAWFDDNSIFKYGKYKGLKVSSVKDDNYISWMHHSKYNVYFVQTTLDRLGVVNKGKMKMTKQSVRIR